MKKLKIYLTGSTGMVGKNILEHPLASKYEFLTPNSSELNLTYRSKIDTFLKNESPDIVIHAAGIVGGIQANINNQAKFLSQNSLIGINLIDSCRDAGVKNFINLASSCMYPKFGINPLQESSLLNGILEPTNEGYALSKLVSTKLCEYVSKESSAFSYRTLIPCNLYGRHDHFETSRSHLIPAIISKIHNAVLSDDEDVVIWGDGTARREFMYAEDLADFIFHVIPSINTLPQNTNVGLGYDFSIKEYYSEVSDVIGFYKDFTFDLSKPVGMQQKLIDTSVQDSVGWSPKTSLRDGIEKTYNFYKSELNNEI